MGEHGAGGATLEVPKCPVEFRVERGMEYPDSGIKAPSEAQGFCVDPNAIARYYSVAMNCGPLDVISGAVPVEFAYVEEEN